jgi:hypothetical protein
MRRAFAGALVASLLLAGCDSGGPQPGTLTVKLAGPQTTRSAKFRVVGPVTGVSLPNGSTLTLVDEPLTGDTTVFAVFAVVGDSLNGAVVATIDVPDVHAVGAYHAQVIEAASPAYALLTASQFALTVAKQ